MAYWQPAVQSLDCCVNKNKIFTLFSIFDYCIVTNFLIILQKKFKRLKRIEDEDSDAEEEDVQGQIRKEIFEGSGDVSTHWCVIYLFLIDGLVFTRIFVVTKLVSINIGTQFFGRTYIEEIFTVIDLSNVNSTW